MKLALHIKEHEALGIKSQTQNDNRYVMVTGDTMTGNLDLQKNYLILQSDGGTRYRLSVANNGALVTEEIISTGLTGQPFGAWLFRFTYS